MTRLDRIQRAREWARSEAQRWHEVVVRMQDKLERRGLSGARGLGRPWLLCYLAADQMHRAALGRVRRLALLAPRAALSDVRRLGCA